MLREYKRRGDAYGRTISNASKQINITAALTNVDDNKNITGVLTPYNPNRIMEQIKTQIGHEIVNINNYSLLKYIIDNSAGWVGSHVHRLEDWVKQNLQPPQDIWTGGDGLVPQFDWPLCTTTGCSYQGLGYCGSFCVGGHCDYRTVVPGQWVGNQWIEGQKDMHYELGISIFFK